MSTPTTSEIYRAIHQAKRANLRLPFEPPSLGELERALEQSQKAIEQAATKEADKVLKAYFQALVELRTRVIMAHRLGERAARLDTKLDHMTRSMSRKLQ